MPDPRQTDGAAWSAREGTQTRGPCATSAGVSLHVLAFDTATAHCGAALLCADGRHSVQRQRVTTHSESLLLLVQACLDACGLTLRELGGIACSAGPGSFTGLRIGMATAKGLCFALGLPLCTVSSLEALGQAGAEARSVLPTLALLDAFRGQLFARLLPPAEDSPLAPVVRQVLTAQPQLASDLMWQPEALTQALQPLAGSLHVCAVDPIPMQAQALCQLAQRVSLDRGQADADGVADGLLHSPTLALATLARKRLLGGQRADLFAAAPNYLCGSAPEEAERQRLLSSPTP